MTGPQQSSEAENSLVPALTEEQVRIIRRTLQSLQFGQITIDIADGQVVSIGRRVQTRLLKRRIRKPPSDSANTGKMENSG